MSAKKKGGVEHINYAIVAKAHTPMYLMHKWWARKPHNVVSEYIQHYTKEGDIVLDPFCGSGVTPIEAIKLGRKGIGIDLDPMATFITKMTAMPVDAQKISSAFEEIRANREKEISELYRTKCKKCGAASTIICTHWENSTPIKIYYVCSECGKMNKRPEDDDLRLVKKTEKLDVPFWYPERRLYYDGNGFLKKEKSESIPDLFTRRNMIALSMIFNEIGKVKDNKTKEFFRFAFTSMVHLASKLTPVRPTRPMSSFWAIQSYWVPPINMESNVWMLFDSSVNGKQGIVAGKEDSSSQIKYCKEARKFSDLNDGANIFINTQNALELTDVMPKNSVDYVFTDPPYGGAVQYFELSTLWSSWLKMNMDYKDEITINSNQSKDFEYYHKMLRASFKAIYQLLKPGKYMTVTFHSTDIRVWNSIIKAVAAVGFELEKIIYQPPARPSAKGLLQPYGSAVGDYYIRFRKPEKEVLETDKEIDLNTYEMEVVDAAQRIIGERSEPTIYQHILNGIMAELQGGRRVPVGAKNIEDVLKEHIGKEFEIIPVRNEDGKVVGKKWWLKGIDVSHFSQPTLSDRVERKVVEVLEHDVKISFDDILQAIFIEFKNALTPETEKIRDVLKEYAETSDGKWQLKPDLKFNLSESAHDKMIYMLASLGKEAGFDVWIGLNEQSHIYNNRKLASLVTNKNPIWRFIPSMGLERAKQIDVIWHDEGRVKFEFEVENTTAITEAVARGSNIPGINVRRIIVIPKEREGLLSRKVKDPLISENMSKNDWKFIFYQDLEQFFNKRPQRPSIGEFEKLFKLPKEAREKQNSLKIYV
ncbi:MAG: hypothetical protein FJY76_02850 [Candidatus Aenigmarchaeota archaeon]|nr:hypothetical protein [Candidatus Aenigmarchaeota archaeon]